MQGSPSTTDRRRRRLFAVVATGGSLVLGVALLELGVRATGFSPRSTESVQLTVEPGGRLFTPDPLLGYRHLPGSFEITLADGYRFVTTHDEDGHRVSQPLDEYLEETPRPEIWLVGGSFVHGWSVDDARTAAWLLQMAYPDYDVLNLGVSGYGTVHALLQVDSLLATGRRPDVVIYGYTSLHNERNTFSRARREALTRWNRLGELNQPAARLRGDSVVIAIRSATYRPFPLSSQLAAANAVETAWNRLAERRSRPLDVTRALLTAIDQRCRSVGVRFVAAGLNADAPTLGMLAAAASAGVDTLLTNLNLDTGGMRNLPHDRHPGPRAHAVYADAFQRYIRSGDNSGGPGDR